VKIGSVEVPFVYWLARNERIDFEIVIALSFDVVDFFVLEQNLRLFRACIAALFVLVFDSSLAHHQQVAAAGDYPSFYFSVEMTVGLWTIDWLKPQSGMRPMRA
jgi:hypothetical protein